MEAMRECFVRNKNLGRYDIRYNNIQDNGMAKIIAYLAEANHVFEIEISERVSKETMQAFKERIALNKPRKKKKGKKKKKKK